MITRGLKFTIRFVVSAIMLCCVLLFLLFFWLPAKIIEWGFKDESQGRTDASTPR